MSSLLFIEDSLEKVAVESALTMGVKSRYAIQAMRSCSSNFKRVVQCNAKRASQPVRYRQLGNAVRFSA